MRRGSVHVASELERQQLNLSGIPCTHARMHLLMYVKQGMEGS